MKKRANRCRRGGEVRKNRTLKATDLEWQVIRDVAQTIKTSYSEGILAKVKEKMTMDEMTGLLGTTDKTLIKAVRMDTLAEKMEGVVGKVAEAAGEIDDAELLRSLLTVMAELKSVRTELKALMQDVAATAVEIQEMEAKIGMAKEAINSEE